MCAGPVKNLIEDATGVTAKKNAAKEAAKQAAAQAAANEAAAEAEAIRLAELEASKQAMIEAAAAEQTNIQTTLGDELAGINQANSDLTATLIANANSASSGGGPSGPSASELAARGAAQTSQSVLNREKKKKKNSLAIPYSPSKRKDGQRGPKSTKADLQIEGQTQSTGTGTNLAI
jgi:hypothetical protein